MQFTLPIYYKQEFKTKPAKTHLLGMNWYNGAHYQLKNKVKAHYHSLVADQAWSFKHVNQFKVHYTVFFKNPQTDISNVVAVLEKFFLDGLKSANLITDDSNKFHLGSSWAIGGQDKANPRIEITLQEV